MTCYCSFEVARDDNLLHTMDRLERALDVHDLSETEAWAEQVGGALADVERLMEQHRSQWNTADSPYQTVDLTRPTLSRKLASLRLSFGTTLVKAIALREKFERITTTLLAARPVGKQPARSAPSFDHAKSQGQALVEALRSYNDKESRLVLESSCTDLGAGD